ncbi:MAG: serine/threonine protein kinase [Verrucomicrobia bacterium]|nr:serine/threonine protein kinase [Verrucomicrobiota bacterium]
MQIQDLPQFRMIRKIPKGGLTDLYVCSQPDGKRVVVRFIKEQYKTDRHMRKTFTKGLNILKELNHPGVVKVLEDGKVKGMPYMVIEYHESDNLRECILHQDPILRQHSLTLVRQLAAALAYVHSRGYLHMDLKPENMLIKPSIDLLLIDFDLCMKHRGSRPVKMKILPGTPTYLAPETLVHRIVDERSEVFAFGVAAYELLCSHKPFEANSVTEYKRAVVDPRVKAYPVHEHRKDISKKLEDIVMKCLSKKVELRYPSMALVKRDLDSLL